jgi:hypothetical protein
MEPRIVDDDYPELSYDWGDYYRRRMEAKAIEEVGGDPVEVKRLRDEAGTMDVALRHRHAVELEYWKRYGEQHPRKRRT